jgi:sialate O-acetylesterase
MTRTTQCAGLAALLIWQTFCAASRGAAAPATTAPAARTTLPSVFGDHMVLQRDLPLPVWGRAGPGVAVTVRIGGAARTATADAAGTWAVQFPPIKASETPTDLAVSDAAGPVVTVHDVLVGDVWVASGQSNMELALRGTDDGTAEVERANEPRIRFFRVRRKTAETPQFTCAAAWEPCTPDSAGPFSAVAYYFARDVLNDQRVPIGVIGSYAGGTRIESWLSLDGIRHEPLLRHWGDEISGRERDMASLLADYNDRVVPAWQKRHDEWERDVAPPYRAAMADWNTALAAAKAKGDRAPPKPKPAQPEPKKPNPPIANSHKFGDLYNAMIAPVVPFAIKGVVWYQGESNADNPVAYRSLFPGLIADWRRQWARAAGQDGAPGDFPFLFVQLPNFVSYPNADWPGLREAQAMTAATVANSGMVVTIDLGNDGDLHPKRKAEVGHRLARAAEHLAYGQADVAYQGPTFASMSVKDGGAEVVFTHVGQGLTTSHPPAPGGDPTCFMVAGGDGKFIDAEAKIIAPDTVRLSSGAVSPIVFVRYAYANTPHVNLYGSDGLPAAPFRTDNVETRPSTEP